MKNSCTAGWFPQIICEKVCGTEPLPRTPLRCPEKGGPTTCCCPPLSSIPQGIAQLAGSKKFARETLSRREVQQPSANKPVRQFSLCRPRSRWFLLASLIFLFPFLLPAPALHFWLPWFQSILPLLSCLPRSQALPNAFIFSLLLWGPLFLSFFPLTHEGVYQQDEHMYLSDTTWMYQKTCCNFPPPFTPS